MSVKKEVVAQKKAQEEVKEDWNTIISEETAKQIEEREKEIKNMIVQESIIVRVMDRETRQVIKIDMNREKDYKTKYLHCSWKEFEKDL